MVQCLEDEVVKLRFCPTCNAKLEYVTKEDKLFLVCPRCGYEEEASEKFVAEERGIEEEKVTVIGEDEKKIRKMPTTRVECPKCGYKVAYWWMTQTRGGDEAATQFFRCKKCNHTWRLYG